MLPILISLYNEVVVVLSLRPTTTSSLFVTINKKNELTCRQNQERT